MNALNALMVSGEFILGVVPQYMVKRGVWFAQDLGKI